MNIFTKAAMAFCVAAFAAFSPMAASADYPEKPVQIVVPWPPGDLEDVLSRMIAEDFQKAHGVPTAVVNKPSGGGGPFPGAAEVARAPADGYMIGSFVIGVPIIGPHVGIAELNPNPFEPLGIFLTYPFVIVAGKDAPYDDMKGLAAHAKNNKVVLGHFGDPLVPTKVTKVLAKELGFSFSSDAAFDNLDCNSIASGDVDVMNTTLQLVLPCLNEVKVLASIGGERISLTPDTPTVSEIVPWLDLTLWNGLFVHKDTPRSVRKAIIDSAKKTVASDRAQKLAAETGALVYWENARKSTARIKRDAETFGRINAALE